MDSTRRDTIAVVITMVESLNKELQALRQQGGTMYHYLFEGNGDSLTTRLRHVQRDVEDLQRWQRETEKLPVQVHILQEWQREMKEWQKEMRKARLAFLGGLLLLLLPHLWRLVTTGKL